MDVEVDIIEFRVPIESNKTLFVWGIQPCFTEAFIYDSLWNHFSAFGALYLLKVSPNAAVAEPGFYALLKYYSAAQASKAQRSTHGRRLFQNSPLKVKLSTKQPPSCMSDPAYRNPLSHSRCQELANHYLGFNGWSTHIITVRRLDVKELSDDVPGEQGSGEAVEAQERILRYGSLVEVTFPLHRLGCRGVGVAQDCLPTNASPEVLFLKRGKLQRWARDKAVVHAFSKVLLLLLGSGKMMVEVREERDEVLPDEQVEGTIQVNEVPWSQFDPRGQEEEEDWNLTVS
ncbi:RAD52 motif-containing protein 1 [Aplochiton taeniatus]